MSRHKDSKPTKISRLQVGDYLSFKTGQVHLITQIFKYGRYERQVCFEPSSKEGKDAFNCYGVDLLYRLPKRLGRKLFQAQQESSSQPTPPSIAEDNKILDSNGQMANERMGRKKQECLRGKA